MWCYGYYYSYDSSKQCNFHEVKDLEEMEELQQEYDQASGMVKVVGLFETLEEAQDSAYPQEEEEEE